MGPYMVNAQWPTVDGRCRGTTISCCLADPRCCLPTTSVTVILFLLILDLHTHSFNGLFLEQPGYAGIRKATLYGIDFNDASDDGVIVSSAGPYANHLHFRQITHAITSALKIHVLQARCSSRCPATAVVSKR